MAGRKIQVEIVGDTRRLQTALGSASTGVQRFGDRLKSTGRTLTTHMTLPIAALGAVAVKTAADFDSSLEKIQGLVGANTKQMAHYRKSILDLAPAVAQGPKALADALYFVTSSGFKGAQALDILKQSAKASTAGLGDTQQIADLVTSAMTAYGAKTLDAAQATDILVAATKAGKGDPQEFAQALQLNVAAANTLGISFDQLAAATAALSTVNSNVSEDATALSGIMTALIKPSKGATEEMKKLGFSAAGLRQEIRDKGLLATLLDLQKATHGNIAEIGKLFPNVRGLRGFLTLVGKAAEKNVSIFEQVAHSTGDLNRAFQTALSSDPKAQYAKLTAQLQVLAIVIGETLMPILLNVAGAVVSVANEFKGLSGGMQNVVLIGVAVLAALGPIVSIVGTITTVVAGAATAFRALAAGELLAAAPITLIVVALAALAVGLVIAYHRSETFRNIVNTGFHAIQAAAAAVSSFIRGPLASAFHVVQAVAGAVIGFIRGHWQALVAILGGPFGAAIVLVIRHLGTLRNVAGSVLEFFRSKWNTVTSAVRSLWGWINSVISAVQSLIGWISRIHVPHIDIPSIPGLPIVAGVGGGGGGVVRSAPGGRGNPIVVQVMLDRKVLAQAVAAENKDYTRQNGRGLFT